MIPTPQEIISAVEEFYGKKFRISIKRTRNHGVELDMQSIIVWLMRSILGFSYEELADQLYKDPTVLWQSGKRIDEHKHLLTIARSIHRRFIERDIEATELAKKLRWIALTDKPKVTDIFVVQVVIHRLGLEVNDTELIEAINHITTTHRGHKTHQVRNL